MDEISLAAERIERAALAGYHAAASRELREALGLRVSELGGVLASMARHDPSTILNRAIGLGVETPATRQAVRDVRGLYAGAGIERFYFHLHPEARPPETRDFLAGAGLVKGRGWQKFHREPDAPFEARSDLQVRRAGREHASVLGRIAASGFGFREESAALLASTVGRPGWHHFLTFDGDLPAGGGALFVRDGRGWLDWAATLPAFRGRGSQGLVLRERIRASAELGCRRIFTATGEAVEGDPQHSYRNILRAGFRPLYLRENWVPAA